MEKTNRNLFDSDSDDEPQSDNLEENRSDSIDNESENNEDHIQDINEENVDDQEEEEDYEIDPMTGLPIIEEDEEYKLHLYSLIQERAGRTIDYNIDEGKINDNGKYKKEKRERSKSKQSISLDEFMKDNELKDSNGEFKSSRASEKKKSLGLNKKMVNERFKLRPRLEPPRDPTFASLITDGRNRSNNSLADFNTSDSKSFPELI